MNVKKKENIFQLELSKMIKLSNSSALGATQVLIHSLVYASLG